jgi:PKHD-type hydroxylase
MLLHIKDVLDETKIENIRDMLAKAEFVDGKLTAGKNAQRVKNNEEMKPTSLQADYLDRMVMNTLAENEEFRRGALPHQASQPVFAKYVEGMEYGNHIDDPVMGTSGGRFRCDVAITLFLSDPSDYDGGELIITSSFGEQSIKLPAGDAVLYPASSIHRVAKVTRGERLVSVCWVQSLIRDPMQREILYNLNCARQKFMENLPEEQESHQVDQAYVNLVRMWAEV